MFGITAQENCMAQLPTSHPFRTLENVLATPHIDYLTEELPDVFTGMPRPHGWSDTAVV